MTEVTIGRLISAARAGARLTQRELARRSGTSAAAICEYETGRRLPRVDTLERIVEAAGAELQMELHWPGPPSIDVERNGRILVDLLDLADHLPRRSKQDLEFPPFARLAG